MPFWPTTGLKAAKLKLKAIITTTAVSYVNKAKSTAELKVKQVGWEARITAATISLLHTLLAIADTYIHYNIPCTSPVVDHWETALGGGSATRAGPRPGQGGSDQF